MTYVRFLLLSLSVGFAMLVSGCGSQEEHISSVADTAASIPQTPQVCSDTTCFGVEIADEPTELQHGLMGRKELATGSGMLFVFPREGTWQFWMKDTLISLDILRIGSGGVVTHIAEQVPPCLADPCPAYGPTAGAALYVLEIASGMAKQSGIEVGKELKIKR